MSNTTNTTLHTVALFFVISADKATQKGIDAGAVTGTQQVRALTSKALSPVQFQTPDRFLLSGDGQGNGLFDSDTGNALTVVICQRASLCNCSSRK
ncbi:hypothetical protein ACPEOH_004066 [Yersinia enterocolitica]|nr:hypothetical protein [Yersinia enterocolitica]HDL8438325.1 hypothetical protein [Yersinia enterocolitica]HDM8456708.1 hypothetical protein [Yersinia enterocolitica]HDW8047755.1 hypothetical protein [Yersinia enterocolitica]HEF9705871.1 hypothetical protein [Yersinia enterocolitica]